jgi:hypothetical protein
MPTISAIALTAVFEEDENCHLRIAGQQDEGRTARWSASQRSVKERLPYQHSHHRLNAGFLQLNRERGGPIQRARPCRPTTGPFGVGPATKFGH